MQLFSPRFCGQPHDIIDGKPVDHECYILSARALVAERAGDIDKAISLISRRSKPLVKHKGKTIVSRQEMAFAKGCTVLHLWTKSTKAGESRSVYAISHRDIGIVTAINVEYNYSNASESLLSVLKRLKINVGALDILRTGFVSSLEISVAQYKTLLKKYSHPDKAWFNAWTAWEPKK